MACPTGSDFGQYLQGILGFLQEQADLSAVTLRAALQLLRKTLGSELVSNKAALVQCTLVLGVRCTRALDAKLEASEKAVSQRESEVLFELAETLSYLPLYLGPETDEDLLFQLLESNVSEDIQRSAYCCLRSLYQNFIPDLKFVEEPKPAEANEEEKDDLAAESRRLEEEAKEESGDKYVKDKLAFKNVSEAMIAALEHPPNFKEDEVEAESSEFMRELVGASCDTQVRNKTKAFGYLLVWNSLLNKIEQGRIKATLSGNS